VNRVTPVPVVEVSVPPRRLDFDASLPPIVLDFDGSVPPSAPDERRIPLEAWRERIGFGCSRHDFACLEACLDRVMPEKHGPVFLGSGDFHHVTLALLRRFIRACAPAPASLDLVILDNHPDNMLYPFGVHCGSWAGRAAALEAVRHVHAAGITSPDIGLLHAWENDCRPFLRKKLTWWSIGRRAPLPALIAGKEHARRFRSADALLAAFLPRLRDMEHVYLSVDKDVLHADAACTGWDQGLFRPEHLEAVAACCAKRLVGVDVCGDYARRSYRSIAKRLLCRLDGLEDAPPADERSIRERGRDINLKILEALRGEKKSRSGVYSLPQLNGSSPSCPSTL
jgi:arginase family enzyme